MKQVSERNLFQRGALCLLLAGLMLVGYTMPLQAQNRRIRFEKQSWEKCLKKARKQDKLVFLDCYTQWCGFCKALDQYIFTMDTVADFFNGRFVNVQMDMEKGIGPELCEKYNVRAYPTLLFVDGDGNLVDSWEGYAAPAELFAVGNRAMDAEHSLIALTRKYEAGERQPAFLEEYMSALKRSTWSKRCREIMQADVASLSDNEFCTPAVWSLLKNNTDTGFDLLKDRVAANRERFDNMVGEQEVDSVLDKSFTEYTASAMTQAWRHQMDTVKVQQVVGFLQAHRLPYAGEYLATLYTARALNRSDYKEVVRTMREALKYNFMRLSALDEYINTPLRALASIDDMEIRREAAALVKSISPSFIRPRKKAMYDCTYDMLMGETKK